MRSIPGGTWTREERTLLEYLTGKVAMLRLLDAKRIWKMFRGQKRRSFEHGLQRLRTAGLIEQVQVNLHPALRPRSPLLRWRMGQSYGFDIGSISDRARRRWSKPHQPTLVLVASPRAANLFGSTSRALPPFWNWNHDALLGEVLAHYQATQPMLLRHWVGEHLLPKAGYRIKDPDAFLVNRGLAYRIVESGGSYSEKQIQGLVNYAVSNELELEVW